MRVFRKERHYDCCNEDVEQLVYELTIRRKPLFFLLYMIFPVCAVVFLSLLGFVIPPESGERIGFGVTILLTMGVYLMVISEDLPKTAHSAPLIGVLYVTLFYVMILGYVASTVNVNFSLRDSKPPDFLLRLARKQKLPPRQRSLSTNHQHTHNAWRKETLRTIREGSIIQRRCTDEDLKEHCDVAELNGDDWLAIKDVKIEGEGYTSKKKEKAHLPLKNQPSLAILESDKNNDDWRRIAAYLDKIFFMVFLTLIIISGATVLVALEIMYG